MGCGSAAGHRGHGRISVSAASGERGGGGAPGGGDTDLLEERLDDRVLLADLCEKVLAFAVAGEHHRPVSKRVRKVVLRADVHEAVRVRPRPRLRGRRGRRPGSSHLRLRHHHHHHARTGPGPMQDNRRHACGVATEGRECRAAGCRPLMCAAQARENMHAAAGTHFGAFRGFRPSTMH